MTVEGANISTEMHSAPPILGISPNSWICVLVILIIFLLPSLYN